MAKSNKQKTEDAPTGGTFKVLQVGMIQPSEMNPRKKTNEAAFQELKESIAVHGVLQPITVRPSQRERADGLMEDCYEIVCGERRWCCCVSLHKETIPAIVRVLTDEQAFDLMIVENLQRKDLDPLDEAVAYAALVDRGASVNELVTRFGKSEKYIRGRLSLNDLIDDLKKCVTDDRLPLSGAIMLARLTPEEQEAFYNENVEEYLATGDTPATSVADIKDYLDYQSCSLAHASFLSLVDKENQWNVNCKPCLCEKCPHNTRSQYSLFPEMDADAPRCLRADCFHDKALRFAEWFINFHLPNLARKDDDIESGDFFVLVDDTKYKDNIPADFLEKYNQLRILNNYEWEWVYSKEDELKKLIDEKKVVKAIYVGDLCVGNNPWQWIRKPTYATEDDSRAKARELWNKLRDLQRKRSSDLIDALHDTFKDIFQNLLDSEDQEKTESWEYPTILWLLLRSCSMYLQIEGVDFESPRSVRDHQASLAERPNDCMRLGMDKLISKIWRLDQLKELMEGVDPSYVQVAEQEVHDKYDADIEHIIKEMADLGYTPDFEPIKTPDDETADV